MSRPDPLLIRTAAALIAHQKRGDLFAVALLIAEHADNQKAMIHLLHSILALVANLTRSATSEQIDTWSQQVIGLYSGDSEPGS